jgi:hypothetical protein
MRVLYKCRFALEICKESHVNWPGMDEVSFESELGTRAPMLVLASISSKLASTSSDHLE